MKAIAYQKSLPISDVAALQDVELPAPLPGPRDLLVRVRAVSVNPVDTKVRRNTSAPEGQYKVLGYDAAGVVEAVGADVSLFKEGDAVYYAGSIARPGTNAELHVVDERIVGHKPANLDFAQAAALPLTALTAWELLFDRLGVSADRTKKGEVLLITGAAGGVGSILVQLARQLTGLTVIGTASRPESAEWIKKLGAHHVIDHSKSLVEELKSIGLPQVTHVASLTHTHDYYSQFIEVLAPQGKLGLIDDPEAIDLRQLKRRCLSLHWEMMFARPVFETPDMIRQHEILDAVARLVEQGTLVGTASESFGRINAENLRRAHALLESGKARGKVVLEGF
ncbi:MAG: zinc-binding alcohol dehydrogenase family protein [Moraxellaceae bacterium]